MTVSSPLLELGGSRDAVSLGGGSRGSSWGASGMRGRTVVDPGSGRRGRGATGGGEGTRAVRSRGVRVGLSGSDDAESDGTVPVSGGGGGTVGGALGTTPVGGSAGGAFPMMGPVAGGNGVAPGVPDVIDGGSGGGIGTATDGVALAGGTGAI